MNKIAAAPPFELALLRAFGAREELRAVLREALRRNAGGRVYLTLMADGTLRLLGSQGALPCPGAVLLDLGAPAAPAGNESLALRLDVIDWRACAHRYDVLAAQRAGYPTA